MSKESQPQIDSEKVLKPQHKEYHVGEKLDFILQTLDPSKEGEGGIIFFRQKIKIARIAGGGFFGKVLIPEEGDFVIKTSQPDSFHESLRSLVWGLKPFPAQTNEYTAWLEHLATRLIYKVLPVLTNGKFYSPDSFGYTKLPNGFAQVVEKVKGRGPRFDLKEDEYIKFKQAQKELLDLGLRLGLDQVGQIHPDNPFGMANLWYDDQNQKWIWLDTIPAIPHNLPYKFHRHLRNYFCQRKPTFNRIRTSYFLTEVVKNRHLFLDKDYEEIKSMLTLYEQIWAKNKKIKQPKDIRPAARAIGKTALELGPKIVKKGGKKLIIDPIGITFFKNFRKKEILKGAEQAKNLGLLTEEQWKEAVEVIENPKISAKDKMVMTALLGYYGALWWVMKAIEGGGYFLAIQDGNPLIAGASFTFGLAVPPLIRYLGTRGIGFVSKTDLKAAAAFSAIPFAGNVAPIPANIAYLTGSKSKALWHYYVRDMIAGLSAILPQGGWSTDLEAVLWEKIGVHLEKLAQFTDKQTFYKPIGKKIGGDLHGVANELDNKWVVKTLRGQWRMIGNWKGKLEENLISDCRLLQKYVGDFIPQTHIVKGIDQNGEKSILFVQKRINGRTLREIPWEEITASKFLIEQLEAFQAAVNQMYQETNRTPDLHGGNKDQYNLKLTKNLMVDENSKLWFVDIDLIGPLWSLNNPLGAKHREKIMESLSNFMQSIQREYLERKYHDQDVL